MGKPKLTTKQRQSVCKLAARGHTQTELARRYKVSQSTIARALRAGDSRGPTLRRRRSDIRSTRAKVQKEERQPEEVEAVAAAVDAIDDDAPGALDHLQARLEQITRFADSAHDATNPVMYEKLVRLETYVAERIIALTPPAPPDPEHDPEYQAAKDRLIDLVAKLVDKHGAAAP